MSKQSAYKAMIGLRLKETYEDLINYLLTDQEVIRYPDRYAKQLRESPYLTQLDGEGLGEMQEQQERQFREQQRENTIRQVASTSNQSVSQLKAERVHRETFSQTDTAPPPDVKMNATTDTQTDNPVTVSSGTGTDDLPPPPGAGAIRMDRGTSPLPPPHHYEHLNNNPPPPPPPPEAQRIRKSTTDASTQDETMSGQPPSPPPPPSSYVAVRKRNTNGPYEQASSSSGRPPPPPGPPPLSFYIGDTTMGSHENRALSVEMRKADEAHAQYESKEEKRAKNRAAFKEYLMQIDKHPMKRAADEASNAVHHQALELAHASAKARRANEMQAKQNQLSMQEELKRQAAVQRAQVETAKQEVSEHHKAREASHQKRVASDRAELDAQRKNIEAQRKTLEIKKKKPAGRPKRQAEPTRTQSAETVYYPPNRSASVDTVDYRSRSRAKSAAPPILPVKGEVNENAIEPVKRPRGRPRKEKPAEPIEKKPRGRPRSKA